MDELQFEKDIRAITESSAEVRGKILEVLSEFEFWIDYYITRHFTNSIDKEDEFMCLIIAPNVTFRNKIEIFQVLVNKYHPQFKENHKTFFADFIEIVDRRNEVAHLRVDTRPEAIRQFYDEQILSFIRFKKGGKEKINDIEEVKLISFKPFSESYVNNLINLIIKYCNSIKNLLPT